ncbi:putative methyltransferase-domain-containing protein [Ochromonadaceae sp. CCMP2298]|nr:putative methyltransferase-domain-containing protein [Ochromonadaceae sp. CCMP2298]|mmetsp:Transcript_16552/g.37387  ORF Transcript_16552/g.37387 Transcript_16552/m.37387 type:complete len:231 (+) Transcript_16552:52-744(+)
MDEDGLGAIGFMFDAEHERETRQISFGADIQITLRTIGDKPGHVQSGQYLWPAAAAAGEYLIAHWGEIAAGEVMELGAGCGLAGLVATQQPLVRSVTYTDYDRGSLQLIEENIALNSCVSVQSFAHFLEWGVDIAADTRAENGYPLGGFGLVLGTDLIYSRDVIVPLFTTVSAVLHEQGTFLLVSSFELSEDFEAEIERICLRLRLVRETRVGLDEQGGVSKVETFRFGQ